jgi:hypothetical protein
MSDPGMNNYQLAETGVPAACSDRSCPDMACSGMDFSGLECSDKACSVVEQAQTDFQLVGD